MVDNYDGAPDFGSGPLPYVSSGAFVLKLDGAGDLSWVEAFGGNTAAMSPIHVAVDGAGNILLAGAMGGSEGADFGGGKLPFQGGNDLFVAKLSPAGAHVWSDGYGSAGSELANSVAIDGAGNLLLAIELWDGSIDLGGGVLSSLGEHDIVFAKLTASGDHAFSVRAGDAEDQVPLSVAADPVGNLVGDRS